MSRPLARQMRGGLAFAGLWLAGVLAVAAMGSPEDWVRGDDAVRDAQVARGIAQGHLESIGEGHRMVILDAKTREQAFGWVFSCTSAKFLETGNPGDMVPGFGPLVVYRRDGSVEFLPTSLHPDAAIETLEKRWVEEQRQSPTPQ